MTHPNSISVEPKIMTTKEVIQNAERITIAHAYGDDTFLYDILVDEVAYSVRVNYKDLAKLIREGE